MNQIIFITHNYSFSVWYVYHHCACLAAVLMSLQSRKIYKMMQNTWYKRQCCSCLPCMTDYVQLFLSVLYMFFSMCCIEETSINTYLKDRNECCWLLCVFLQCWGWIMFDWAASFCISSALKWKPVTTSLFRPALWNMRNSCCTLGHQVW